MTEAILAIVFIVAVILFCKLMAFLFSKKPTRMIICFISIIIATVIRAVAFWNDEIKDLLVIAVSAAIFMILSYLIIYLLNYREDNIVQDGTEVKYYRDGKEVFLSQSDEYDWSRSHKNDEQEFQRSHYDDYSKWYEDTYGEGAVHKVTTPIYRTSRSKKGWAGMGLALLTALLELPLNFPFSICMLGILLLLTIIECFRK